MKYYIYIWKRYSSQVTFKEVANMMCEAINKIPGNESEIVTELSSEPDSTNIIFGANDSIFDEKNPVVVVIPENSIIINLEQMGEGQFWSNPKYINLLKQYEIWDYSDINIKYFENCGIQRVKKWNLGWADCLKFNLNPTGDLPIDILFYGALNDRRMRIYTKLKMLGVNVVFKNNVFGEERNYLISQSKVVLNMHYYDSHILEVVRITPLLINGKCVVSEFGGEPEVNKEWGEAVVMSEYGDIVKNALRMIYQPELRKQQEIKALKFIKNKKVELPIAFS